MKIFKHEFGGIATFAPETWIETTEDVEIENAPFTLAKKDIGVGALQFSIALYKDGEEPNIDVARLKEMLVNFADDKGLGEGFDEQIYEKRVTVVASSYHVEDDLIRYGTAQMREMSH